ncbi:MAG TPA: 2-amino-4-hydroxy-6-hydroxymethyldihydropteridine diphosphokinase [Chlamydiales bacterium]|nr:2-amino-4-hydroxy-6-hydroxymethyldihydropteridine diphosphokinase [Chlamydiales bacterium]
MSSFEKIYLSLGANLTSPKFKLEAALQEIGKLPSTKMTKVSSLYQTKPISSIPQEDFLNIACELYSSLPPFTLLGQLQEIEKKLGKVPKPKSHPRPIDIDMIFYGSLTMQTDTLILPHPHWRNRLFVLVPLNELTDNIENTSLSSFISQFSEEEIGEVSLLQKDWFSNEVFSSP